MLTDTWRKFKGWEVLEFFLDSRKAYVKELSRLLKIGPGTAQTYMRFYEKEGILTKENIGNTTLYTLSDTPLTRELKRAYLLMKIFPRIDAIIGTNPRITGLVLYGSAASGEYDQNSDIDMLAIAGSDKLDLDGVKKIEGALGREVHIELTSIGRWKALEKKQDAFYLSVSRNHLLLYGALP